MTLFHVGIDPTVDIAYIYNSSTKEVNEITISWLQEHKKCVVYRDTTNAVIKKIFEKIKSYAKGKLGCASIVLDGHVNKIRKDYISIGLETGFEKIEIIDPKTAKYLHATFYSKYIPKNDDVIWVIHNKICDIWKKMKNRAKYIRSIRTEKVNNYLAEEIIEGMPSVILYDSENTNFSNLNLPCFHYQTLPILKFWDRLFGGSPNPLLTAKRKPLIHARLVAHDPDIRDYDIERMLDTNLIIQMGNGDEKHNTHILSLEQMEQLPMRCNITLKKLRYYNQLIIENAHILQLLEVADSVQMPSRLEERISLPSADNLIVTIIIDHNGIFTVNIKEMLPENFATVGDFLDAFYGIPNQIEKSACHVLRGENSTFCIPKHISSTGEKTNIVGIDVGTTRCCAAVNRINGIQTVALENTGPRLLPSYVAFDEANDKCGQIVVDRMCNKAKFSVFDSKRIIGRTFEELIIDESWTFDIVNDNGEIIIQTLGCNNTVLQKKPEEISAVLLKHIKQKTEEFQGKKLIEAVITVPATFNNTQKEATISSAILAGWETLYLFPEPVAAAFAYFNHQEIPDNSNVLLFDLGGGTLDVCIFRVLKGELKILSSTGDPNLGGRDFDNLLFNFFKEKLENDYRIIFDTRRKYKLIQKCQDAKETLSVTNEYLLDVEDFGGDDTYIPITREQFENLSQEVLDKIQRCIDKSLESTGYQKKDMDKVLYVGGGCRMLKIKELLRENFPHSEHCCEEHPDEVVAIGAACYAEFLNYSVFPNNENQKFLHVSRLLNFDTVYRGPKTFYFNNVTKGIGIDFGTRNCCAVVNKNWAEAVELEEEAKQKTQLLSYVSYDGENPKCGEIVANQFRIHARSTVFDILKLIGKNFNEIEVDEKWKFDLTVVKNRVKLIIQHQNTQITKYPEEIAAVLLKHIKKKIEVSQKRKFEKAVITIPTTFNENQKDALRAASLLAGWKTIILLEEPIAAAFAYLSDSTYELSEIAITLVFDLGYNSLKIHILQCGYNKVSIIGSAENFFCGAKEFDIVLFDYFVENIDFSLSENQKFKLMKKCQEIKHNLSVNHSEWLDLEEIIPTTENLSIIITRGKFESKTRHLLKKMRRCINVALNASNLTKPEIYKVLLAGGGCKMPMIRNFVNTTFRSSKIFVDQNLDEVIAKGAAYFME